MQLVPCQQLTSLFSVDHKLFLKLSKFFVKLKPYFTLITPETRPLFVRTDGIDLSVALAAVCPAAGMS
jgi:hypothetical protein